MTPREYIDRERHRTWTNLRRANERGDEKDAERLAEELDVLMEIESGLETVSWRRVQACHLMRVAAKVLATVDSMNPEYSIVPMADGGEYTIRDILLDMGDLVNAWEGNEQT